MPKMKTRKTAAKRFHVTGTGKIMRSKGMKSHLRRNKSARVLRQFDEMSQVAGVDRARIQKLIPYGVS
ncbi:MULTISPECIES: 50S ribosomal protein L35 [Dehalococcoides]|jgi:large subunit ribosomal protein L35|uniref:Large ribosomal subunit protein bL35 n=3 Tax=Dehalococcoides mccartyi TaxID=61435 RepID=RL35_DEHMC|nr:MULTISPECIES: 50S ribosomal protein L35 [Dehalococcoides]A5FRB1.1 RecName: Full=Large ribosomal subunit protein bL35; AltName: Full=50S ribosomal protein L35 [Dehalococcoides mccartyi BAV1]Q3ZXB7.1 RecName: Full=Large ribosomal subunit protein bL35; AltName: Full=50S ribosomal protein L35 [Dehalococcoides mccartyi CBDB1]AGG06339.1 50S ribosomal protein L35 [Dehalococcoides mccartyi DCMB5]AGG07770.1 50S ribosomal protein L35 [Dehalococcoides mccartyi BTF08]AII60802.1 50S ribosomal protein L3